MRIKFLCSIDNKEPFLNFNYGYKLRNLIYDIIGDYDSELSNKLHNSKEIKNLLISDIFFEKYEIKGENGIKPLSNNMSFVVSSSDNLIIQALINSKMKHIRKLSDTFYFKIDNLISENFICSENKIYKPKKQTPILISISENGKVKYIDPTHKDYKKMFFTNLIKKANKPELLKDIENFDLEIVSDIKHKNISKKSAYLFDFKLKCPEILIKHGMLDGFGINNSEGFGYIK